MQTNFVSKSPLILGLLFLVAALISFLGSVMSLNLSIPLIIGLVLFAMCFTLLSAVFLHMYIKEMFVYYIEVYLVNVLSNYFKGLTNTIESNHSYLKLSFDKTFKALESVSKSLEEYQRELSVLNKSIDTKLTEIGLDISERKKSVEIINKRREEAIEEARRDFKDVVKFIGENIKESNSDLKEALKELESQQLEKEDIQGALEHIKFNSDGDLSKANLAEEEEHKLVLGTKDLDEESEKDAVEEEK